MLGLTDNLVDREDGASLNSRVGPDSERDQAVGIVGHKPFDHRSRDFDLRRLQVEPVDNFCDSCHRVLANDGFARSR
jgi:hypothetical protein